MLIKMSSLKKIIGQALHSKFLLRTAAKKPHQPIILVKDYYIDGQNTQLILFWKNDNWGREKGPPNYNQGVDFLDHDVLQS